MFVLSARQQTRNLFLAILLGVGARALVVGIGISRSIVRPLSAVVGSLKEMAEGAGDLTSRLEVASKDEVGALVDETQEVGQVGGVVTEVGVHLEETRGAHTQGLAEPGDVGEDRPG